MIAVDIRQRLGHFDLHAKFEAEAQVLGIFGRSGAGKSSIINAIAGITRPSHGYIRVNDVVLFDAAKGINLPPEQRRVGYVFQDGLLFPHMSVAANLRYGQRLRALDQQVIAEDTVVALLGLEKMLERRPRHLSGGEKQRVAIGRALLAQPRMLLMDEPLAALDIMRKGEILDYIECLRDEINIPIVYVSHSVTEVSRLADTVVIVEEGRCIAVGDTDEVMSRADLQPAVARYEGGTMLVARVSSQDSTYALTTLAFDGGELVVPHLALQQGDRVQARIRARDVALATTLPTGLSIVNILGGTITAIDANVKPFADVSILVGNTNIIARITQRSAEALQLHTGQPVYALVKAVSFDQRTGRVGDS